MSALYFRKTKAFKFQKNSFKLDWKIDKTIFELGISSFIIQIAIVIVMTVANLLIGKYGPASMYGADIPLAVIGIVMKVFAIVIAFAVGIAVGGQPIAGYNYGAGNFKRVFETYKKIIIADSIIGLIATALFEFCPQIIVRLFGNESELYNQYASTCFRIFLSGILLCCIQKASSIFLQSIGKPVKSTILSLARDVIFFVPALIIIAPLGGVTGMLWAAPIADVLALITTIVLIYTEFRNIRKNSNTETEG
jgi:Na+-driven multidrug efflux pump